VDKNIFEYRAGEDIEAGEAVFVKEGLVFSLLRNSSHICRKHGWFSQLSLYPSCLEELNAK
jgi:hypothetical protein